MSGYSGTPLVQKLGIKPGHFVYVVSPPGDYAALVGSLPENVRVVTRWSGAPQVIHVFVTERADLERQLKELQAKMPQDGMIWVSWPKKSAKIPTSVTEDVIRQVALPLGLVDVKVCAVDEVWSGLKLVIRVANRKPGRDAKKVADKKMK